MTAKAWGAQQKPVDEIFLQNHDVSLCLLVNRRAKTMRVVDFRAGPTPAKRAHMLKLAVREGVEKVYTLVERDEVGTWVKLGLAKEGTIPGFYKRSDAYLLGCSVRAAQAVPFESETRIALGTADVEDDVTEVDSAAHKFAEKTLAHAKRHAKDISDKGLPTVKIAAIREADAKKHVLASVKAGRALTAFEPFGRDVKRDYFALSARGGFELIASVESQACFGNAFLELLVAPKKDADRIATIGAVRAMCQKLIAEGTVSCFSLSPSDDLSLATAFVFNGFRRTGLLLSHLVVGDERKDAIIWSRKLANPADE